MKNIFPMKCLFYAGVILLLSVSAVFGRAEPDRVVVAVGKDSAPYYFLDPKGRPSGLVVDIWKKWSEKTGITVTFRPMAFAQTLDAVRQGEADIHAGCYVSGEREKTLDFISPVAEVQTHFFFRRNIFGVDSLDDLMGFRIGIIQGDAAIDFLKKEMPRASLAVYPDNPALFDAIRAGDIVAFVKDTNIALTMLADKGMLDQFRYYERKPLYRASWYCAVKKGNLRLAQIVGRGMASVSPAEKQRIVRQWTGIEEDGNGDRDILTVACTHDYPPMSMISASGNPSGLLVDVWRLWSKKTGRKVRFRFFNWEASLAAVENGDADIHSGLFRSEEREKRFRFSKAFYQVESGFFHRQGPTAPARLADLNGKTVGVEAGTLQMSHVKERYKEIRTVVVPSSESIIQKAHENEFFAFFAELPFVSAQLERRGEQGIFGLLPGGRMTHSLHAGVAMQNAGLLETVNKGLEAMTPAELARIEARWIKDPTLRQLGTDARVPMLTAEEKAWLKSHRVIPILGESDWPPLDFAGPGGEYKGVAADYVRLIGRRLGVRFEVITDYTWSQMIELVKSRKATGITCIARRKDREAYLDFTTPYFVCPYVIVSHRNTTGISGITDLFEQKVAVEDGYFLHAKLKAEYPKVVPLPVKNTLAALDAVRKGEAHAYIGNLMVIKHLLSENRISDLKITAPSPWPGSKLRIGIRKDRPLLVSAMDKAIESLSPEEHRQINQRWLKGPDEKGALRPGIRFMPEEEAWLSHNKVVVVASESDWPPVNFTDARGAYKGITADYLDLIARRTGVRMEIITDYSWSQMVEMARERQVDMISAIVRNPEREVFLEFTDPYFVSPYVLVTRRSLPRIDSIRDMAGKTIVVENGFFLHQRLEAEYPDQKLLVVKNTLKALQAVARGQADAYAGNLMVIRYLINAHRIDTIKVACPAPWPGARLRLGIRKDWPLLAGIINKALADITAQEHQAVNRKWMDYTPDPGTDLARLQLTREERAWLNAHPDIRLGVDPDWPPFEFISNKKGYAGMAAEYMKHIQKALGHTMAVQQGLTWTQALDRGRQKKIDVFPCITPSADRARFLNFTRPYLTFPMVVAARTDFPFISSLKELKGNRVAVVKDYISHEILEKEHPDLVLTTAESVRQGLELVSRGKADAFVGNLASITYYSKRMGLTNIKIAAVTPYSFDLAMGVRSDWPLLPSILDKALDAIPESEKNRIRNAWIAMRFEHGVNWRLLWKWIAGMTLVSGAVLSIILYSNRKLKQEVDDRKRAEAQLGKLSKAVEQSPVSVVITDTQGHIEYVNPTFTRLTGYTAREAIGQNPRLLKSDHTPPQTYEDLWTAITAGRVWQGEFRNKKKNGELFWEAANISPILSREGVITHFLCVKEDITQRKEMEHSLMESHRQLKAAAKRAEAADRAKGEFLANMSHEIRTPMNAIIGMTHLTLQTGLSPQQQDYVAKIDTSAKSLLGLINDILDFSKIEAGKLDMEIIEFSLDETLDHLAGLITVKAGEKQDLEVLFRVDPAVPHRLKGDPLRLNQVLVNLGNNAVKFTDKGHIIVAVNLLERAAEHVTLKFSVTDSGIGMTRAQQAKLFKAFSQADTSTTRKYGGTGLGLIISKRIVEVMGGDISLESAPGKGSTFSFTVPLGLGDPVFRGRPALDPELSGINVLVIDDNPTARQIFLEMLESFSLAAKGAGSGGEALEMLKAPGASFDLVLADMNMPDMDGLETARAVRSVQGPPGRAKIILVCTGQDENTIARAREMELNGILLKPASHSGLFNAIAGAFGSRDAVTRLVSRKNTGHAELPRTVLGARILLVEDHDINQQVAKEILEAAGFRVRIADNGEEGRSLALSQSFDLVLMDLQMPVMDGYDATWEIRRHKSARDLPIIAMTASAMPKDREKAMAAGMNDHVSKPIDLNELFGALSKWIKPGNRPLPENFGPKEPRGAALYDVPGIAVEQALSRLDRNQDLYLGLLAKFKRDYARADRDIKEILALGKLQDARRLAHSIKGVAGNIGMTDIQAAAEALETAFKDGGTQDVEPLLARFSTALSRSLLSAEQLCRKENKEDTPPKDRADIEDRNPEELTAMLRELSPFVREREAKPAKEQAKRIASVSWPRDLEGDVENLSRLVSKYRFKQAGELMDKLMEKLTTTG